VEIPESLVPPGCDWPIVLGIDPGTRATGYGALVLAPDGPRLLLCGVIRPREREPVPDRLAHICAELEVLLERLRPGVVVIEKAFAHRNVQSALRIGEARGAVLACVARHGISIQEFAPAVAKKAVVGHGAASKEQIAAMVPAILGSGRLDVPADATDALALALAEVARRQRPEGLRARR
jgi:crossover junction endodeoxyribonuclease RuvC